MDYLYKILGLIILAIIIMIAIKFVMAILNMFKIISRKKVNIKNNKNDYIVKEMINNLPYRKKYLLTNYEMQFYKNLKIIADELNLLVLSKIRFADLVEVYGYKNNSEFYQYFGKIKAKHIDFALAEPENLNIVLLIEYDDSSHKREDRKVRDKFIDNVCKKCGYKILHIENNTLLKEKVINKILE